MNRYIHFSKSLLRPFIVLSFLCAPSACLAQKVRVSDYGFGTDPTKAILAAFKSKNDTLVIDYMGKPWVIEPITFFGLKNKVVVLEEGVEIVAKPGAFPKVGHSLFRFKDCKGVQILGNGATLRMNKEEYTDGEWRHVLSLWNCSNFYIEKLTLCDSGGDGIFIDGVADGEYSENITIKEILATNNKRQGISIISAKNVFVYNSVFQNTIGTLPGAGVDLEPDTKHDRMENINFYDCTFKNNYNAGIKLALEKMESDSWPVSILFKNCVLQNNFSKLNKKAAAEITIFAHKTSPVQGSLTFEDCLVEDSQWGLLYSRKVSNAFDVWFKDCIARNICQVEGYSVLYLEVPDYFAGNFSLGGYRFENVVVAALPASSLLTVRGSRMNTLTELANITGNITILGESPMRFDYIKYDAKNNKNVSLELHYSK